MGVVNGRSQFINGATHDLRTIHPVSTPKGRGKPDKGRTKKWVALELKPVIQNPFQDSFISYCLWPKTTKQKPLSQEGVLKIGPGSARSR